MQDLSSGAHLALNEMSNSSQANENAHQLYIFIQHWFSPPGSENHKNMIKSITTDPSSCVSTPVSPNLKYKELNKGRAMLSVKLNTYIMTIRTHL